MTIETIFIFTMSLILLWIKPGPGQALKVTKALNEGFLSGFSVALGVTSACTIFFLIAASGASLITEFFTDASMLLKIVGGSYLIYMGFKSLSNIERGKWKESIPKSKTKKLLENYSLGLFVTLANPLPIFYFLSIMPTLVPIGELSVQDIATGIAIVIAVGLVVDTLILILADQTKMALSDTKIIKNLNLITSIGFMLIGLFLIYSAFFMQPN